jgi:hypothetical protein
MHTKQLLGHILPVLACLSLLALPTALPPRTSRVQTITAQAANAHAPVTSHPRLWLTTSDLPRLRSWATPSNPMYQNGLLVALNNAVITYNNQFFPSGVAASPWPDGGTTNFEFYRKGEWLTKEHSSYSNDGTLMTTDFHNALSLQNHCACPSGQRGYTRAPGDRGAAQRAETVYPDVIASHSHIDHHTGGLLALVTQAQAFWRTYVPIINH